MPIPAPGPAYWNFQFGITSLDEFKAATSKYLDLGLPHISWLDTPLQETAYLFPASVTGVYLTAALTAAGFHEDSPSGPATVTFNSMNPLLNNAVESELGAMPGLVIADCFQVTIQGVAGAHPIDNVIGVRNAGGTAAGAAAAVKTAWEVATGPLARMSAGYSVTNYHAVDIGSSTGTIADVTSTGVGPRSGNFATRGACALMKWNGGNRSRSTRGRLYFGPLNEADLDADGATVASASRTALNTAFTNFRTSLSSSGYPLVVLSRVLSESFDVTAHVCEDTCATQRRRIRF